MKPHLMLITDRHLVADPILPLAQALEGGVDTILLREKDLDDDKFASLARRVQELLRHHPSARLLFSGRRHLARTIGAHGVHLPHEGPSIAATRAILLPSQRIGRSCHDLASARQAFADGADFITLSPLFATRSHPDAPPLGIKAFARIRRELFGHVLALGGIDAGNIHQALSARPDGIALIRGILDRADPRAEASRLSSAIRKSIESS
ncbi:MAG: thiamine phosphate synthase [Magnetococcales bacterium]|nr:thiamine phosphate synthase [Magnetococcales bacterium]